MNHTCFVPNCNNTSGVSFPQDPENRDKWLECLELIDLTPEDGSFICLDHFDSKDIKEDPDLEPLDRLKLGALPCMIDADEKKENCTCYEEQHKNLLDNSKSTPNTEIEVLEKACRCCMSKENADIDVFGALEGNVSIALAFKLCIHPLEITQHDNLPKQICKTCLDSLRAAYEFRKKCITTNDALCSCHKNFHKRKIEDTSMEDKTSKKSRLDNSDETSQDINEVYEETPTSEADYQSSTFEVVYEDDQKSVEMKGDNVKIHMVSDLEKEQFDTTAQSPARRSIRLAHKGDSKGKYSKLLDEDSDIDEIEKNMEEIHGQKSKDAPTEVQKEENEGQSQESETAATDATERTVEDILSTLEEDTVSDDRDVLREFLKKSDNSSFKLDSGQPQKKIVVKRNFPKKVKKPSEVLSDIKLPKDVQIKPVEKYASSVGKFRSNLKTGVYESVFVQADEYLFELGLIKSSLRHLRCSVPTCSSQAKQKVLESGTCDPIIEVVTPHNHQAPNEATKKKQMFLCVMRKKMQTDRTLNIRNIYEDACIQDPDIKQIVPLRNVINEICRHQLMHKVKPIVSFEDFFYSIETDPFEKLHFTHSNQQFYQEKFKAEEDGSMAVLFGNIDIIQQVSDSKVMYVDASFKIDTTEDFKYQLLTVLVWIDDSYYPILFALVNKKSQLIFRKIFGYLHDNLAPELRPQEIITDYEANLYYALAEIYLDSNIGGSVFYYTQNLYKKICSLNLSRDLETNSYFRNIYHMLLMLPLLPVNTILDGLNNIELEARNMSISNLARPIFDHVRMQWILNVTPELFCVHKLENRINENVIAPFKKLRDFLLLTKGKVQKTQITIMHVIEKLIELEGFLRGTYSKPDKKSFGRDLSSYQKKNVLRAWQYIEDHPKIEINSFFSKVLGYIKCMENQLWIWGFYRYDGDTDDILINATHFSIVSPGEEEEEEEEEAASEEEEEEEGESYLEYIEAPDNTIVMEAVVDQDGVLQAGEEISSTENVLTTTQPQQFESAFLKYVYP